MVSVGKDTCPEPTSPICLRSDPLGKFPFDFSKLSKFSYATFILQARVVKICDECRETPGTSRNRAQWPEPESDQTDNSPWVKAEHFEKVRKVFMHEELQPVLEE